MTKNIFAILLLLTLASCDKKTDCKTVTDGTIVVETSTTVNADIQSSNPDISSIVAKKGFDTKTIMTYDTYGINNVDIKIGDRKIIIKGVDEQTSGILKNSKLSNQVVFGYSVTVDN